jgi:hypothetical protein
LVDRITNSIRPVVLASLLAKGEAQDVLVPEGMRGDSHGKPGEENRSSSQEHEGWLEIERQEGSVTVSRDRCSGSDAEFMSEKTEELRRSRRQSVHSSEEAG